MARAAASHRLRKAAAAWSALLLCLAGGAGCRHRNQGWEVEPPPPDTLAELQALGYIDFAATPADLSKNGTIIHQAGKLLPGYYLYGLGSQCEAKLIDASGRVVRSWRHAGCDTWRATELSRSGDLFVVGREAGDSHPVIPEYVARLSWSGELIWKKFMRSHHDIEERENGGALVLTLTHRQVPAYRLPILDDQLTLLDSAGQSLRQYSMYDMILKSQLDFQLDRVDAQKGFYDVLHTNSVHSMTDQRLAAESPLYGLGNVLVASRNQNSLFVFDLQAERLVWAWGKGILDGPHDGTVLASGNFLVFDNGWKRGRSRVVEVDPRTRQIVWEYPAQGGRTFYSKSRGSSQRLPNGNTLLGNSNTGQALEVDAAGQPVWEFNNPVMDEQNRRAVILRIRHCSESWIDGLLRRH